MREDECIARVRRAGRFDTSDDDYTDAVIRVELISTLHQVFGEKITEARSGAWLKQQYTEVTADKWRYRMPHRALPGVESVELSDAQISYEILGDVVSFDSQPNAGAWILWTYYLRPSALHQFQTAGAVTAVDTDLLTVTVNSLPVNRSTASTIASGDYLDIVHPNGSHELALVNCQSTIASTTLTFPDGTDLQDVEVGDYVRSADQSDWPCLAQEYHECLCVLTAARIWRAKGNEGKARALEAQAVGTEAAPGDLMRFANQLEPRVKDANEACVPSFGMIRGRGKSFVPRMFTP